MNKNYIIIAVLAIVIVILIVGIFLAMNFHTEDIEYENLKLSDTCTVSVPKTNNSTFTDDEGLKTYNATDLRILTYNKNDLGQLENLGADLGLNAGLNQNFKYNHSHNGKNILIHPDDNKTTYACLISNNTTGDVVIIASPNEEILYHVIDTINFTANNVTDDESDEVVEASGGSVETKDTSAETADESEYEEGYIAENDHDFDYDGDGVGDGSAYHSHEYYVERGQTEPIPLGGG